MSRRFLRSVRPPGVPDRIDRSRDFPPQVSPVACDRWFCIVVPREEKSHETPVASGRANTGFDVATLQDDCVEPVRSLRRCQGAGVSSCVIGGSSAVRSSLPDSARGVKWIKGELQSVRTARPLCSKWNCGNCQSARGQVATLKRQSESRCNNRVSPVACGWIS